MAKLLLNLRNVPDDEADEVRTLLEAARIDFYETPPSFWGVSAGGIWVRGADEARRARELLTDYQLQRRASARAAHQAEREAGTAPTVWRAFRAEPLRASAAVIGILVLIAVLALPFLML